MGKRFETGREGVEEKVEGSLRAGLDVCWGSLSGGSLDFRRAAGKGFRAKVGDMGERGDPYNA